MLPITAPVLLRTINVEDAVIPPITNPNAIHITPEGSGLMDGSSFEHALPGSSLLEVANSMLPGGFLSIAGGQYEAQNSLTVSGTESDPIVIEGVDIGDGLPEFTGDWENVDLTSGNDDGAVGLRVSGSNYLHLKNIKIQDYKNGFRIDGNTTNSVFENIQVLRSRVAFAVLDSSNLTLSNINLLQYKKRGLEFKRSVTDVVVNDLTADATLNDPSWITMSFTIGVELDDDDTFPRLLILRLIEPSPSITLHK